MQTENGSNRRRHWTAYDGVKKPIQFPPPSAEQLMSEMDTAIRKLERARATAFLETSSSGAAPRSASPWRRSCRYDAKMADEAYRAGCAALAKGKLEEALRSLNVSLSKCPPDKTSAVKKLQSLINLTSKQLRNSPPPS